jgi:hypothetical protein
LKSLNKKIISQEKSEKMIADDTITESSQRVHNEESESHENLSADVKDEDFIVK